MFYMTDLLEQSLKKAFIDNKVDGSKYDPKIIINQPKKNEFLLTTLQDEISQCEDFFFTVAFITQSGLNALKTFLYDLDKQGVRGRILTSTYLNFNHPEVFESLLKIPNLEVKISDKVGFHSKGYLFKQKDYYSFIVGSSNLTMNALKKNYEWNVRLTSYESGALIQQIHNHMEEEWEKAQTLTLDWIAHYAVNYKPIINAQTTLPEIEENTPDYIVANKMQREALDNLKELRETGATRGLVISATGTGKTYLAALDVLNFKPKRMLFIVHREQILLKAKESFQKILGGLDSDYGILSGSSKEIKAKYLFTTVQMMSKPEYYEKFDNDYFDYILIDEVHKAGAKSYRDIIDYFEPQFLLGMTATPDRTDEFNIFELFDYQIAYEIRLQDALDEDLLCPFYYFGVTDYEQDGRLIDEVTSLQNLVAEERVNYLIDKIDYYGCSHNIPKGLIFCSRKDEAKELAQLFNDKGYLSECLTGDDSIVYREKVIQQLESGEINYIFTVDVFNEGIDIPKINQVVMLRNTQSSIIFIQQLGRGLRKDKSKEFVTVIDFIGNYKNNYMIPMALSGNPSRNKDNMRKDTYDVNYISGLSAINFEEIAKERIFEAISNSKLDSLKELRESYFNLKNRLNRVPYLQDFVKYNWLDPLIFNSNYKNYYDFLVKIKENEANISELEERFLTEFTREFLSGLRRHEILVIQALLEKSVLTKNEVVELFQKNNILYDNETIDSVLRILSSEYFMANTLKIYTDAQFISLEKDKISRTKNFEQALENNYFRVLLDDLVMTSQLLNSKYDSHAIFTPYQKYRRKDAIRLLNWEKEQNPQNVGGYIYKDNKFIIFVTLDKGDDFTGALVAYEDKLIESNKMLWYTKSPRTINSPEVKEIIENKQLQIYIFANRDRSEKDFYYLGKAKPITDSIEQVEKEASNKKMQSVVQMELIFDKEIEYKLYQFLK